MALLFAYVISQVFSWHNSCILDYKQVETCVTLIDIMKSLRFYKGSDDGILQEERNLCTWPGDNYRLKMKDLKPVIRHATSVAGCNSHAQEHTGHITII